MDAWVMVITPKVSEDKDKDKLGRKPRLLVSRTHKQRLENPSIRPIFSNDLGYTNKVTEIPVLGIIGAICRCDFLLWQPNCLDEEGSSMRRFRLTAHES